MIPEPIYYELGDYSEDGHTHIFMRQGCSIVTALSQNVDQLISHSHTLGIVGDLVYVSQQGSYNIHQHDKIRMVRPIERYI